MINSRSCIGKNGYTEHSSEYTYLFETTESFSEKDWLMVTTNCAKFRIQGDIVH